MKCEILTFCESFAIIFFVNHLQNFKLQRRSFCSYSTMRDIQFYYERLPVVNISLVLSDFINLTQVHNFTVSTQDIFTFRRLSVFIVSFTRISQVLMQIMKRFALYY